LGGGLKLPGTGAAGGIVGRSDGGGMAPGGVLALLLVGRTGVGGTDTLPGPPGAGTVALLCVIPDGVLGAVVRVSNEPGLPPIDSGTSLLGVLGPLTLEVVANPAVGGAVSAGLAFGLAVSEATAVAGVLGVVVVPVVLEAVALEPKAGGAFHLFLHLSQLLQPVRAIPAQTRPSRPTAGILPIGYPFPHVEMKRRAPDPCAPASWVVSPGPGRPLASTGRAAM
jgi:hypothetical protein